MKYKYIVLSLCIFSTMSLYAETNNLSKILQKSGEKKKIVNSHIQKKKHKKKSHFIFKDAYDKDGVKFIDKEMIEKKPQSYEYENKSRFKFKFSPGTGYSNVSGGKSAASTSGSGGASIMNGAAKGRGGRH